MTQDEESLGDEVKIRLDLEFPNSLKPEPQEQKVILERVMRCGCGLCGLCALAPSGLLVCKDGPIFNLEELKKIEDFGKYKRDFAGKKISLE